MYAKRIGAEGLKLKVEELLKGLIGGLFEDDDSTEGTLKLQANEREGRNWREGSDDLCGWPRETLLKEVILALGMCLLILMYFSKTLFANECLLRQTPGPPTCYCTLCQAAGHG
jgi:hypothetical protein